MNSQIASWSPEHLKFLAMLRSTHGTEIAAKHLRFVRDKQYNCRGERHSRKSGQQKTKPELMVLRSGKKAAKKKYTKKIFAKKKFNKNFSTF
jgi:hypothetical protein